MEKTSFCEGTTQAPTETKPNDEREQSVCAALDQQGFKPAMARRLVKEHGVEACAYQLQRLKGQSAVRSRTGWLIAALERGDRDEEPTQEKTAPPTLTPQEKAERLARAKAREQKENEIAAQMWAGLDMNRQTYIERCVELEGLSLVEVIKREEHYAFAVEWNR